MNKFLVLIFLLSLIFSCVLPDESSVPIKYNEFEGRQDVGTAVINLPVSTTRTIDASEASRTCDIYEVILFNDQKKPEPIVRSYPAAPGEQLEISMPADEYKIVVLAGKKHPTTGRVIENIFVGSGWAEDVIVEVNCMTNVTIKIRPYAVNLNIPSIVYLDGKIGNYTADGGTYNPLLELDPAGFRGFDNLGNKVSFDFGIGWGDSNPNGWYYERGLLDPMPEEPAEWDLYLIYGWFAINDFDFGISAEVHTFTQGRWKAPYASALALTPIPPVPFEEELHKHISFRSKQGVKVNVEW